MTVKKQATFAERLKEVLVIRGITKADLSRLTGISKSSLTHYEKGDWEGKQDAVYKIARAVNVPEAWLMGFGSSIEEMRTEEKQPSVTEGLSEEALLIAQIVDRLPPEHRRLLLAQVRALESAVPDPASVPRSPKSP